MWKCRRIGIPVPTITCCVTKARLSEPVAEPTLMKDVPAVAKMNEMFTFGCAKHISLCGSSTNLSDGSSYSGCACSLQKAATAMFHVHESSLGPTFHLRDPSLWLR